MRGFPCSSVRASLFRSTLPARGPRPAGIAFHHAGTSGVSPRTRPETTSGPTSSVSSICSPKLACCYGRRPLRRLGAGAESAFRSEHLLRHRGRARSQRRGLLIGDEVESDDYTWVPVSTDAGVGFVIRESIQSMLDGTSCGAAGVLARQARAGFTADVVNLRTGPGLGCSVLGELEWGYAGHDHGAPRSSRMAKRGCRYRRRWAMATSTPTGMSRRIVGAAGRGGGVDVSRHWRLHRSLSGSAVAIGSSSSSGCETMGSRRSLRAT